MLTRVTYHFCCLAQRSRNWRWHLMGLCGNSFRRPIPSRIINMIPLCESNLFPHDHDYDGTDADHLPVIPGHDPTPDSKPKEDDNQTQRPALTAPESEVR